MADLSSVAIQVIQRGWEEEKVQGFALTGLLASRFRFILPSTQTKVKGRRPLTFVCAAVGFGPTREAS